VKMKMLLSFVLLSFLGLSFARPSLKAQSVLLVPGDSEDFMYELIGQNFDVRGMYGGYVFLFTSTFRSLSLSTRFAGAVNIEFPHSSTMVVVEGDSSTEGWGRMLSDMESNTLMEILFKGNNLVFLGVRSSSIESPFDLSQQVFLPRDAEFITLPSKPIVPIQVSAEHPIYKKATFKASVAELVSSVNEGDLRDFALYLSGEGGGSNFRTRHSFSADGVLAGEWAIDVFTRYGFNASSRSFPGNYCPNIVAEMRGTRFPNQYVIVGAHLDCRNRDLADSTGRAPGANDDGSGSAAILQIAKAIFDTQASFESTVSLHLYCGEEQGLVGSRALSREAAAGNMNIIGMFQADMIAYQAYPEPQCAFVNRYTNTQLTNYAKQMASLYVPEIRQVDTSACCSDHQSYYEQGYPSVGLVEGGGYTVDVEYHAVGDVVDRDRYSLNQMRSITRVLAASAADLAGIH